MLTTITTHCSFAVRDAGAARAFYADTLGLRVSGIEGMAGLLRLELEGAGDVLVYEKPDHEPAGFTVLNFVVGDIEAAVDELAGSGVELLRYDRFEQDERGISREAGGPAIAWFADPSGNVLSVYQQP